MPPDSTLAALAAPDPLAANPPSLIALFLAFAKMSLSGFGGVLAFARRGIVEEHKWMTAEEFNETFALCHFLTGPNIVNLTMVFGSRFRGILGGVAAFTGLLGPPVVVVVILGALYVHFGQVDALRRVLAGISCAAVGLLIAVLILFFVREPQRGSADLLQATPTRATRQRRILMRKAPQPVTQGISSRAR